ncbi:MAG: bifunctional folylpolyglutamate synthase/dihydrofolate synthase [bacterium]|nr:bifunctional folylpolyglutamate synthase/dihydrofolate synthase [bacterium]
MITSYQDALDIIEGLSRFGSRLGLERINRLLLELDNPQDKVPVIHIGGTNGKGSVSSMISSVLINAGYKVGLYTSPHLHSVRERIQIDNKLIDKDSFVKILNEILPFIENLTNKDSDFYLTQFEILTAMAFLYFYRSNVDVIVLEVGLGGRLDATNVVSNPLVSIITNVDWDHMDRLGNTLSLIGKEKAGIIKRGVPVVTGAKGEGLDVIVDTARSLNAPIYILGRDFFVDWYVLSQVGTEVYFRSERKVGEFFSSLKGLYQVDNMAISLMALELLRDKLDISDESVIDGLRDAFWPGRIEIVSKNPVILLDGAHNKGGAEKLSKSISLLFDQKPTLIVGMLRDKDAYGIINAMIPYVKDEIIVTSPKSNRALDPIILGKIVEELGGKPIIVPDVKESVKVGLDLEREFMCIMGSLYTVAEARESILDGVEKD